MGWLDRYLCPLAALAEHTLTTTLDTNTVNASAFAAFVAGVVPLLNANVADADADRHRQEGRDDAGRKTQLTRDQCIRADCSIEGLAALPPAFNPDGGSVTAGNSSPINVGAAAMLMMSESRAEELGLQPIARIRAMAVAGVDPTEMGIGPIPAVESLLAKTGLSVGDFDVIESNEAFAAQALAVNEGLGLDPGRVNPNGGAIALGHPVGATGAILTVKALSELDRTGGAKALITMCIGGGQGIAIAIERM